MEPRDSRACEYYLASRPSEDFYIYTTLRVQNSISLPLMEGFSNDSVLELKKDEQFNFLEEFSTIF